MAEACYMTVETVRAEPRRLLKQLDHWRAADRLPAKSGHSFELAAGSVQYSELFLLAKASLNGVSPLGQA